MAERAHAPNEPVDPVVRHYGAQGGTFRLWDDDGETDAPGSWRQIEVSVDAQGRRQGRIDAAVGWSAYREARFEFLG